MCCDLSLQRQTFHLAVQYVDSYLSAVDRMDEEYFQYLGAASLYLACKMEERNDRRADLFVQFELMQDQVDEYGNEIVNHEPDYIRETNCVNELLKWEDSILHVLDWNMRPSTSLEWLLMYFQNAALQKPVSFGDSNCEDRRINRPRFIYPMFMVSARKLDELVASRHSIELPGSFIAALVFYYACGIYALCASTKTVKETIWWRIRPILRALSLATI